MTTEYRKANAAFPDPSELNRRLAACPEPSAKRKFWLAAEWLAVRYCVMNSLTLQTNGNPEH